MIKKHWKKAAVGIVTGILNGMFGSGGGCIVIPAMEKFLGIDEKKSHATAIAVILMMSVVSSAVYIKNGFFDFRLWLLVSAGGIAGGMLGAKILAKLSGKWLKIIFGALIIAAAIKMII